MGFFSDLKEDLSQAVNELLPEDAPSIDETSPNDAELLPQGVSLEEMLKNIDDVQVPELTEEVPEPAEPEPMAEEIAEPEPMAEEIPEIAESVADEIAEPEPMAEEIVEPVTEEIAEPEPVAEEIPEIAEPEPEVMGSEPEAEPEEDTQQTMEESKGEEEEMDSFANREAVDETAVITAGMQITGDIVSEGSVDVIGKVNGNIDVLGKLNITGHINGNSKAAEIYAEGKINGEVISEGAVKIGSTSVIIGNISATSAAIAGAVKGDIDVKGPVILDSSAIVMGNIKSKSVQINNGAVIEGMCSQCYADVSPTAFFDDYKIEEKTSKKSK